MAEEMLSELRQERKDAGLFWRPIHQQIERFLTDHVLSDPDYEDLLRDLLKTTKKSLSKDKLRKGLLISVTRSAILLHLLDLLSTDFSRDQNQDPTLQENERLRSLSKDYEAGIWPRGIEARTLRQALQWDGSILPSQYVRDISRKEFVEKARKLGKNTRLSPRVRRMEQHTLYAAVGAATIMTQIYEGLPRAISSYPN